MKTMLKKVITFIRSHKKLSIILFVVILLFFIIFRPKPPALPETVAVKNSDVRQTISASGNVDSVASVNLNFLTAGKLVSLNAQKGDTVKKGQVIATLDSRTTQKNLENALRDYSLQRNTFDTTEDANLHHTPQDALNDSMRRILEDNQYNLDKAVISVELQDLAKQSSILTTPIDGIVTRADVTSTGVNIGATTTFTIADPENLVVKLDIDEADIGKVKLSQNALVTLDAFPDQTLRLPVTNIDFASHTTSTGGNAYTVDVALPKNADFRYRIGMGADADIILAEKKNVLTIPISSLDGSYVYVVTGKNVEKRKVVVGLQSDTDAEIKSGLELSDKVALDPEVAKVQVK